MNISLRLAAIATRTAPNNSVIKKLVVLSLISFFVAGCAGLQTVPLIDDAATNFTGKSVVLIKKETPDLSFLSIGKALFLGPVLGPLSASKNKDIKDIKIDDPADYIGQKLAEEVSAKYGFTMDKKTSVISGGSVSKIAARHKDFAYALDVSTIGWQVIYFLRNPKKYNLYYSAGARLIDTSTGKIVANGFCNHNPIEYENAPTRDELLANDGERLKKELQEAADYCLNDFRKNIFNIN